MLRERQRNEVMRLLWRRAMIVGLFVLVLAASWSVWGVYRKDRESVALKREAQAQLADLTKRQVQLSSDITKLQTDRGKEEALRQQYALAGEGEHLLVIIDPPAPLPVAATTTTFQWLKSAFWWW